MTKLKLISSVLVTGITFFAAGAFLSYEWTSDFDASWMPSISFLRNQAGIVTQVSVLNQLRAGRDKEGIRMLETLLDHDIIVARYYKERGQSPDANVLKALEMERQARESFGHTNNDVLKAEVAWSFIVLVGDVP